VYPAQLNFYFFFTQTICHQAVLFKRDLFSKCGYYDETLKIVSDWKFIMLAIVKYNASYKHINDTLCVFDNTGLSNTETNNQLNIDKHITERDLVLQSEFPLFIDDYTDYQLLKYYFKKFKLDRLKNVLKRLKF
jgi:hypothetical protein